MPSGWAASSKAGCRLQQCFHGTPKQNALRMSIFGMKRTADRGTANISSVTTSQTKSRWRVCQYTELNVAVRGTYTSQSPNTDYLESQLVPYLSARKPRYSHASCGRPSLTLATTHFRSSSLNQIVLIPSLPDKRTASNPPETWITASWLTSWNNFKTGCR